MIAAESVAVILLAAGLSTRFGAKDKLSAPLGLLSVGDHAATMLATFPFAAKIAVVRADGPDFRRQGFEPVVNRDPASGQSGSIRLGLAHALPHHPQAVLIALADMPFVTSAHVQALLARFDAENPVIASGDGGRPGPPVVFGAARFPDLALLSGDSGARTLLRDAALVAAPATMLADIDTPDDLDLAASGGRSGGRA